MKDKVKEDSIMVELRELHKYFGDNEVLKGINLKVKKSEVVVVIGPSGSGKSTLLRCVNLLEQPTSGEVYVENELLNDTTLSYKAYQKHLNRIRSEVGMVFQQFNLFPHMTVLGNIIEAPMQVQKKSKEEAIDIAARAGRPDGSSAQSAFRRTEAACCYSPSTRYES